MALIVAGTFVGCRATQRVAQTSVDFATAPVRLVRHGFHRDGERQGREEVYEGVPIAAEAPPAPNRSLRRGRSSAIARENQIPAVSTTPVGVSRAPAPPAPSPAAQPAAPPAVTSAEFPTAKAVPEKPGFVYSPFDGTMIDVTGFASGAKAKDPGNNKIFIVP